MVEGVVADARAIAASLLVHGVCVVSVAWLRPLAPEEPDVASQRATVVLVDPGVPEAVPPVRVQVQGPRPESEPLPAPARGREPMPSTKAARSVRGSPAPHTSPTPETTEPTPEATEPRPEATEPSMNAGRPGHRTTGLSMRPPTSNRAPGGPAVEARALAGEIGRGGLFDPPPPPYRPEQSRLVDVGNGRKRTDHVGFGLTVARDGSPRIKDKPSTDLTIMLMRAAGIDPYVVEKLALLDGTREERAAMAEAARGERIVEAERRLPALLVRVWDDGRVPPELRRRLLFELWDECAEDGRPDVVAAGHRARAIIMAFVRGRLPVGGAAEFPAAELVRLNGERTSRARFEPY